MVTGAQGDIVLEEVMHHRRPMLLLDRVAEFSPLVLRAEVTITSDSEFFSAPHGVPAWIGVEYMAQAIAALLREKAG